MSFFFFFMLYICIDFGVKYDLDNVFEVFVCLKNKIMPGYKHKAEF